MKEGATHAWRDVLQKHHLALVDELSALLDSSLREAVASAVEAERLRAEGEALRASEQARRSLAELLNLAVRRLRQAQSAEEILRSLHEGAASSAEVAVILTFENNQARVVAAPGSEHRDLTFDTQSAPAVISAIDTRDPVVALGTAAELSAPLARIFDREGHGQADSGKVYLLPIVSKGSTVAMLAASGSAPDVGPLEVLCETAGMRLETLGPAPVPNLLRGSPLSTGSPSNVEAQKHSWEQLTPEDQKIHLRAQRMARVRVAEIRLNNESDMKSGAARADIYGALKVPIESARDQFRENFVAKCSTMVDYLHLEILRTLAHDDDKRLGEHYPGPMV